MSDEKKYYVYLHKRKTDNSIFYVGKGCGPRAKVESGRSRHWHNTAKKHGYIIDFAFKDLTAEEAKKKERDLIKELRKSGALLVNISSGGDGGLDCEMYTEETREKMRAAKLGRKQNPEHAMKSARAKIGKMQPRDAVEKTRKARSKKVINSAGEVFVSASDAARVLSKRTGLNCSQGNISMASNGIRREAYGFSWSYNTHVRPSFIKRIIKCSNGMKFDSVVDAANWVCSWRGKSIPSNITNAMSRDKTAYGFKWKYEELTE